MKLYFYFKAALHKILLLHQLFSATQFFVTFQGTSIFSSLL